ncbi:MAG: TetR/AcrR family transcriptional regulator [Lachnospiraceae bacterium]|nr:TetR/AcrR family transcriptional regulator [Lachnospiraceae bacterium]
MKSKTNKEPTESHNKAWYKTHSNILNTYITLSQRVPVSKIKARDIIRACGIHSSTFYSHFKSGITDVITCLYNESYQDLWERCNLFLELENPSRNDVLHLLFPSHPNYIKNHDEEILRNILQFQGFNQLDLTIKEILEDSEMQPQLPSYEDYISYTQFVSSGVLSLIYGIVSKNSLSEKQYKAHIDRIKISLRTLMDERNRILSSVSKEIFV